MKHAWSVAIILSLSLSSTSRSDDTSDDSKKSQGTWLPKSGELAGKPLTDELLKNIKLVIKDGKYTVTAGDGTDKGTVKLDPSTKPKSMDITGTEGPNKGKTILAIYELNGDTLKVCYDLGGKDRPKEFKTKDGIQQMLITYKRE